MVRVEWPSLNAPLVVDDVELVSLNGSPSALGCCQLRAEGNPVHEMLMAPHRAPPFRRRSGKASAGHLRRPAARVTCVMSSPVVSTTGMPGRLGVSSSSNSASMVAQRRSRTRVGVSRVAMSTQSTVTRQCCQGTIVMVHKSHGPSPVVLPTIRAGTTCGAASSARSPRRSPGAAGQTVPRRVAARLGAHRAREPA